MVIYMNLTSRTGCGERFVMVVLGDKSPKDYTHPLDCVTEAVLYQDSVSTSMAVLLEDRIMVIYMNLTSRTGCGERFVMVVLGDQGRSMGAG